MYRLNDVERSMKLLSTFWNGNDNAHNIGFPWEQYTFNHDLWPNHPDAIKLIEDTNEFGNPMFVQPSSFLMHVVGFQDITHPGTRHSKFLKAAQDTYGLSQKGFEEGYRQLIREHHEEVSDAGMNALGTNLANGVWDNNTMDGAGKEVRRGE